MIPTYVLGRPAVRGEWPWHRRYMLKASEDAMDRKSFVLGQALGIALGAGIAAVTHNLGIGVSLPPHPARRS